MSSLKPDNSIINQPSRYSVPTELQPDALWMRCDPASLGFATTDSLPDLQDVIGQPRALRALELGSEVTGPGYNIFVLGLPGSGRTTLSLEYLQRKAASEPIPDDWCYVNNFNTPHTPRVLRLPPGRGNELQKDMQALLSIGEQELPRAFESEEYSRERDRLVNELKKNQEAEFIRLQEYVEKYKFAIVRTPFGVILVPAINGKPLTPDDIQNLPDEMRTKFEDLQQKLGGEVEKSLKHMRELTQKAADQLNELNAQTALFVIGPIIDSIKAKYSELEEVLTYLDAVQVDMVAHARNFRASESSEGSQIASDSNWKSRYSVNLLVDNSNLKGAPVILESQPAYYNLLGRIEHIAVMGATRTDFTMIRAGALHRANGGYLVLSARDLLINPYAWEGLKRVLRDGAIRIIELGSQLGLLSTETLDPEPIPLDIKIILVGTPLLYYLLRAYDEDFAKLFKVRAEFASSMDRTPDTEREYGLFVKSVVEDNNLPPFDCSAVARIIEYSARLAEDQRKLTTRFGKISDLIREAAYWAKKLERDEQPSEIISAEAVQRAIDESIFRNNLVEERVQELIANGTLMIDTSGLVTGQVNALSVIFLGDHAFGRPSRLTATVSPGKAGVLDIERQAKLGGPIHTKGVLILSGFLGARFGRLGPLSLSASLTFEQSYEEVEGDSASAAELFALLSAIADIPLRQDIAVTGSINQRGQLQPIGGVNEKIEGFFQSCKALKLTGSQGVIIPKQNIRNLMLHADIIQAVAQGQFHIWPVSTVDEGLEILTGLPAGQVQPDGTYPEGSFNRAVMDQLTMFTKVIEKSRPEALNATIVQSEEQEE